MMNQFSLLSLSDGTIYGLNASVSLLPNERYTCTGEYLYEEQPIKSHEHSFKIQCGELLIKNLGLVHSSSLLSLLHTWQYLPIMF